jgi:hypothetical protein
MQETFWLINKLLVFQKELCSKELYVLSNIISFIVTDKKNLR